MTISNNQPSKSEQRLIGDLFASAARFAALRRHPRAAVHLATSNIMRQAGLVSAQDATIFDTRKFPRCTRVSNTNFHHLVIETGDEGQLRVPQRELRDASKQTQRSKQESVKARDDNTTRYHLEAGERSRRVQPDSQCQERRNNH
jgi:hypothetical protein